MKTKKILILSIMTLSMLLLTAIAVGQEASDGEKSNESVIIVHYHMSGEPAATPLNAPFDLTAASPLFLALAGVATWSFFLAILYRHYTRGNLTAPDQ